MKKSYYISPMRSNAMIDETMTGSSIVYDGRTYSEITRSPRGKKIIKKFLKQDNSEKLVLYY